MAKQTSIILTNKEEEFLKNHGKTIIGGIRKLITNHNTKTNQAKQNPTDTFYNTIILPNDTRQQETYQTFIESWIQKNYQLGSIDYYIPSLCGGTGFDDQTIRKHFRKLAGQGYIQSQGLLFCPSLRVQKNITKTDFKKILTEFSDLIKTRGDYVNMTDLLNLEGSKDE